MNRTTAFLLLVQKDEAGAVVQLQVALDRPTFDTDGQALVTPAVATADEFESAVNALQAELDEMRLQGKRLLSRPGYRATASPPGSRTWRVSAGPLPIREPALHLQRCGIGLEHGLGDRLGGLSWV